MTQLSVQDISAQMDGKLREVSSGRREALLPSPCVQNHASFLSQCDGTLQCLWFGGSLEGKSDITILRSSLGENGWTDTEQLTADPLRSEQNPVQFCAPDGRVLLLHTAQTGGKQDACAVRMREIDKDPIDLPFAQGTFIRSPILVRDDGAWLLGLFKCIPIDGRQWTGSHDKAALAISADNGSSWREIDIPDSIGCVHMTPIPIHAGKIVAFFRRRQADYVFRTESDDGGDSWSSPEATNLPNNNSSIAAIKLHDGRIALACNLSNTTMHPGVHRTSLYDELGEDTRPPATGGCNPTWGVPRAPIAICLSEDQGKTFSQRLIIEDGPGTCLSNNSLDGKNQEMSYPALTQSTDGSVHLTYTYHRRAIKYVGFDAGCLEQTINTQLN